MMPESEVLRQAWELYMTDAMFYNRVNLAVAAAESRHRKFGSREPFKRRELNAMKTAAAIAIILSMET